MVGPSGIYADDICEYIYFTNYIKTIVGNIEIAVRVGGYTVGLHVGCGSRATIATVEAGSSARIGSNDSEGIDFTDTEVQKIFNIDIAKGIYGDIVRPMELTGGCRAAIAAKSAGNI